MNNPPEANLYLADMVRIANDSKPDIFGFLPGSSFSINLTSDSDDPTREFPINIKELCLYIWVKDSTVGIPRTLEIIAPDGQSMFPEPLKMVPDEYELQPGALNTVINLPGFPVFMFGNYKLNVTFSNHTYKFSFRVDKVVSANGQNFKRPQIVENNVAS